MIDGYIDMDLGIIDVTLGGYGGAGGKQRQAAALIALLNASLPDSDPRKITAEWVREIRDAAAQMPLFDIPDPTLTRIADVLASYLPPE